MLSERRESNPRYAGPNGVCHQIHFALRVVGLGFDPSCLGLQPSAITRFANRPHWLVARAPRPNDGETHARHLAHGAGIEPAMRRLTAVCLSAWLPVNGSRERRDIAPSPVVLSKNASHCSETTKAASVSRAAFRALSCVRVGRLDTQLHTRIVRREHGTLLGSMRLHHG